MKNVAKRAAPRTFSRERLEQFLSSATSPAANTNGVHPRFGRELEVAEQLGRLAGVLEQDRSHAVFQDVATLIRRHAADLSLDAVLLSHVEHRDDAAVVARTNSKVRRAWREECAARRAGRSPWPGFVSYVTRAGRP